MEVLAAVGCEIDEFGCAADLDEQGARKGRGDLKHRAWLVSYMPLALYEALGRVACYGTTVELKPV